ncbi:ComEC family protein [Chimaeribacter arupi]|nr:ComEC family protein [Chimaeribacter arupi]PLR39828.1 ComEC family protein [Chimaeribacter arupi]
MNNFLRAGVAIKLSLSHLASAWVIGTLPLMCLPELPSSWAGALLLIMAAGLWRFYRVTATAWLAIVLLAMAWALIHALAALTQIETLSRRHVDIEGVVTAITLPDQQNDRTTIRIQKAEGKWLFPPMTVTAFWPQAETARCAGQRWQLNMALRPVHSQLNEGGFDSQRWAIANHRPLEGKVLNAIPVVTECSYRQQFISYIQRHMPKTRHHAILLALAFGESRFLDTETRRLLQQTGVAHLMAISGLHITVAALFGWWLARAIQFFLPVKWIGYSFPLILSGLVALLYVGLSGANPPAVRSGLALGVWLALRLFSVRCSSWQVGLWCMALMLLFDPLLVLSDSFWLSCFAVSALLFWYHWCPLPHRYATGWRGVGVRWFHLQFSMFILLIPLQAGIFGGFNAASLAANLWAVPWVSCLVVPLVLLSLSVSFWLWPAGHLWTLADLLLGWALMPLSSLQTGWFFLDRRALFWSGAGWLAVIAWRLGSVRNHMAIGLATLLLIAVYMMERPAETWRLDMIDVGHGLAVLIEKQGKGVLFDTGNRWEGGDSAQRTILPFLRWRNVELEEIIISHSHLDHQGGLATLQAAFPQARIRSSQQGLPSLPCRQGETWQWRGLMFHALWPKTLAGQAGNNQSCVVAVNDGYHQILLTGDIEREAEQALLREQRPALASVLLQVPHHGSNTSSIAPFLRAVNPDAAIVSASRFNAWRLPAKKVRLRYQKNRIGWWETARTGQISVLFSHDRWQIKGFREQILPRWYHQRFGVQGDNE